MQTSQDNWSYHILNAVHTGANAAESTVNDIFEHGGSASDALLAAFLAMVRPLADLPSAAVSKCLTSPEGCDGEAGQAVAAGGGSSDPRPGGRSGPSAAEAFGYPPESEWSVGERPAVQLGQGASIGLRPRGEDIRRERRQAEQEKARLAKLRSRPRRRYYPRRRR